MSAEEKLVELLQQLCDAVDRAPVLSARNAYHDGPFDCLQDGIPFLSDVARRIGPIRSTVKLIRAAMLDYEHEKRMAGR